MGRVDVEEAAAVGAQLLDGDLRGRRADGERLLGRRPCRSASFDRLRQAPRSGTESKFCTTPCDTSTTASTIDSGSKM